MNLELDNNSISVYFALVKKEVNINEKTKCN